LDYGVGEEIGACYPEGSRGVGVEGCCNGLGVLAVVEGLTYRSTYG
jgi:hypothetical protein